MIHTVYAHISGQPLCVCTRLISLQTASNCAEGQAKVSPLQCVKLPVLQNRVCVCVRACVRACACVYACMCKCANYSVLYLLVPLLLDGNAIVNERKPLKQIARFPLIVSIYFAEFLRVIGLTIFQKFLYKGSDRNIIFCPLCSSNERAAVWRADAEIAQPVSIGHCLLKN